MKFSLGQSDVVGKLHGSCKNQLVRNHVVRICFTKEGAVHVEGMLYSQYGWRLTFMNQIPVGPPELLLENPICHMKAPEDFRDLTLSLDAICVANPEVTAHRPKIPPNWRAILEH
jgi:hypothetical protein